MKILLLGEYSNVHNTLAQGLRALGHEVVVASSGDGWKDYPRDIDLQRKSTGRMESLQFLIRLLKHFRKFRGYDVVQIINPVFIRLRAERIYKFYDYLRRHNRCIVMGAFGMDHYYAKACLDMETFRYSDFNFGHSERLSHENEQFKRDWLHGAKGELNRYVAADCDAVVAGLYEYYASYSKYLKDTGKLHFIPFPIIPRQHQASQAFHRRPGAPARFFIGIQKDRSAYKGTDIMLHALERVKKDRPHECLIHKAVSVPFAQYVKMLDDSEVILDQLYSYTPAMNSLESMGRGLINVGGAEPENYDILQEDSLRPIINVRPDEEDVYSKLLYLVDHRDELIPRLRAESVEYVVKHHDYIKVARTYEALYRSLLKGKA